MAWWSPITLLPRIMLTPLYALGVTLWESAYRWHLLRTVKASQPVISVGNLSVGGTGKTPFVRYLAKLLHREGYKTVLLSRGYGRRSADELIVVSSGDGPLVRPDQAGDEPYLLASTTPGLGVVVAQSRATAAAHAAQVWPHRVCILDDGFQHRKLARDLDLVLIDATKPVNRDHLLPWGTLREPTVTLGRADFVVITRVDQGAEAPVKEWVEKRWPHLKICSCVHRPSALISLGGNHRVEPTALSGRRVLALSSIANPAAFERTLRQLGAMVAGCVRFPDHHSYRRDDLESLATAFHAASAEMLVTTEKDAVRLPGPDHWPEDIYGMVRYLSVEIEMRSGEEELISAIRQCLV
jgi:tetraacyldisaccharide 4'-kinase